MDPFDAVIGEVIAGNLGILWDLYRMMDAAGGGFRPRSRGKGSGVNGVMERLMA